MNTFAGMPVRSLTHGRSWAAMTALLGSLLLGACSDSMAPEPELPPVGAVALDASRTELEIGEAVQIIATVLDTTGVVLPGRAVTWSSSDTAVVSVTPGGLVTAVGPGLATVRATSGGTSGELTFTVLAGRCRMEIARPTVPGRTHEGELSTFDCVFPGGQIADGWVLTLTEQAAVLLTLTSRDFDAALFITDSAVTTGIAFDDDGGGGTDARLFHVFDPGTYIVWVTSIASGTGAYRLTSEMLETASCDLPVGTLAVDDTVEHALTFTSCVRGSALSDPWSLSLSEDVRLQLSTSSSEFDTVLEITDAQGQRVAFDDDGGPGGNSLIDIDLVAGDYTVWVTSFTGRQTGTYTLAVVALPPVIPPPTLLSPAPGAVLDNGCFDQSDTIDWEFDWSDTPGGSRFHLYVIHPGAQYPVINDSRLTTSEYRYSRVAYITNNNRFGWTWRVRALVGSTWTEWSETRSFDAEPTNTDCGGA